MTYGLRPDIRKVYAQDLQRSPHAGADVEIRHRRLTRALRQARPSRRISEEIANLRRQRGGIVMVPLSVGNSPRIALNSVDLPTPLRPTKPTRAPGTICTELLSIKSRPAIRTEISDIESMRRCHRSRRQTQPVCG